MSDVKMKSVNPNIYISIVPGCSAYWAPKGRRACGDKPSVSTTTDKDHNPESRGTQHTFTTLDKFKNQLILKCVFGRAELPSEWSYWRDGSTERSFSHFPGHLCPIRRADSQSDCPVLGLRSAVRSPESFQGWTQPQSSPLAHCTPTGQLYGGNMMSSSVSIWREQGHLIEERTKLKEKAVETLFMQLKLFYFFILVL